jgi:hypothetical protein
MPNLYTALLAAAAVTDGLLAGASLDQSIKQLPARHRIGPRAFSAYSQAADLGNGIVWYGALGIGGAVLTIAAAGVALVLGASVAERVLVTIAALLAIAHSLTTARAAPINFGQRTASDDAALEHIFTCFERWQTARALLQLATFIAVVLALVEVGP